MQFALYEMHALLDNAVWLFSMFSYDWKWAIPVTLAICLVLTAIKLSLAVVFVVRIVRVFVCACVLACVREIVSKDAHHTRASNCGA